jgi:hypothetical protein
MEWVADELEERHAIERHWCFGIERVEGARI